MSFRNRNGFLNSEYIQSDYGNVVKKITSDSGGGITNTGSFNGDFTGSFSGSGNGNFTGSFSGSFSGSFTGSFSGTVVGGIAGDGAPNEFAYFNTSAYITSSANVIRDSVNRVGIGAATPNEALTLSGALSIAVRAEKPTATTDFGKVYVNSLDNKPYFLDENARIYGMTVHGTTSGSIQYVSGSVFSASDNFRWIHGPSELRITGSNSPAFGSPNVSIGAQAPKFQIDDKNNGFSTPADWTAAPGLDFGVKSLGGNEYGQGIKWVSNRAGITPVFLAGIFPRSLDGFDGSQSTTALDFYTNRSNSSRWVMTVGEEAGGFFNLPSVQIGGLINDDTHHGILNVKSRSSSLTAGNRYGLIRLATNTTNSANKTDLGYGISFAQNTPGSNESEHAMILAQVSTWGGPSTNDLNTTAISFHTLFSGNQATSGIITEVARFVGNTLHIRLTGSHLEKTGSMALVISGAMAYAHTGSSPAAADNFSLFYVKTNAHPYFRASKNGNLSGTEYDLTSIELTSSVAKLSGSLKTPFRTVSANYNISYGDSFIKVTSSADSIGVTLPSAAGWPGLEFTIKRVGANPVSITGSNSQKIDGENVYVLATNSGSITVVSDDVDWLIKSVY